MSTKGLRRHLPEIMRYRQEGAEDEVIGEYGPMFRLDKLDRLTSDNFRSFLIYRNNLHWKGINRHGTRLTANMPHLRRMLFILLDETRPLKERLNTLFPTTGKKPLPGLGRATATPIMLVAYPDRYGVWNNTSEAGLQAIGMYPQWASSTTFADQYIAVNKVLTEISEELDISLWELDYLWWFVADRGSIG